MVLHSNIKIARASGVKNTMNRIFTLRIKGTSLKWSCPNENQGEVFVNGNRLLFFYGRNVFFYKNTKHHGNKDQCEQFIRKELQNE